MKNDKEFIFGTVGYGIIVLYWVLALIFCTIMLVMHWIDYSTTGETINHMPFGILVFCTILVPITWVIAGFETYMYIHKLKMYNK